MPALSVIVPVYNVQEYVAECLESILDQEFDDVEVIVVDDASTDDSARVVEECIKGNDKVTFIRLDKNVGLGFARNEGLKVATGKYLLFVDSDDWIDKTALSAIYDRLEETQSEVVIFDYAKAHPTEGIRRNKKARLLQVDIPQPFDLHAHPELLTLLMVVWNKAYRRDFIERLGLQFHVGYYEDLPWTYPVLMSAEKISLLDQVCYYYRQRPSGGNILKTSSRKHFDLFDQYQLVFAFIDEHPELEHWRPTLLRRTLEHLVFVVNQGESRIPAEQRREFFKVAKQIFDEIAPADAWPKDLNVQQRLLRNGQYGAFQRYQSTRRVLGPVNRIRKGVISRGRRVKTRFDKRIKSRIKKLVYAVARRQPLDPNLALFYAYWGRGFSCNPAATYLKMQELKPDTKGVWIVNSNALAKMPPGVECVVPGTIPYYRALARATYFIGNVGFAGEWKKRPGQIQVMTHHGTTLKSMGMDLKHYPVAARNIKFAAHMRRVSRWDFSVASSTYSHEVWRRAYPGGYEHLLIGQPRNDLFFNAGEADQQLIRAELGIAEDKIAVLYAPTFRDWERPDEIQLNLERFVEGIGPEFVVLARSHYFRNATGAAGFDESRLIDVSTYPDVQPLCLAADILVTDYSSVQCDYAALARPIVIYASDWDLYKKLRGVYYDLLEQPPGAVAVSEEELIDIFTSRAYEAPEAREKLMAYRAKFCEFEDGRASERLVRRVLLGEKVKTPRPKDGPPMPALAPQPPGTVSRGDRASTQQSA